MRYVLGVDIGGTFTDCVVVDEDGGVSLGFTSNNLPVGITFFGMPYSEPTLLKLAYAYEQATRHRVPPKTTPALPK